MMVEEEEYGLSAHWTNDPQLVLAVRIAKRSDRYRELHERITRTMAEAFRLEGGAAGVRFTAEWPGLVNAFLWMYVDLEREQMTRAEVIGVKRRDERWVTERADV